MSRSGRLVSGIMFPMKILVRSPWRTAHLEICAPRCILGGPRQLSFGTHAFAPRDDEDDMVRQDGIRCRSLPQVRRFSTGKVETPPEDPSNLLSIRERASTMRDTARGRYRDFREHPGQSARDGAKTFGGMLQQYGPVFVGTYVGVYFATLGVLFLGVESGFLDPTGLFNMLGHNDDGETKNTVKLVVDFMEQYELTAKYAHIVEKRPEVANLAVAWIAVKFTEPLRLATSLAITPRIARYFGVKPKVVESSDERDTPSASPKE